MEQDEKPRPPEVVYANIVSLNITTDDMLLEFWEHRPGHATPPIAAEEIVRSRRPSHRSSFRLLRRNGLKLLVLSLFPPCISQAIACAVRAVILSSHTRSAGVLPARARCGR